MLPGRDPSRIRPGPERSVPAAPGGELLVAVQRRAERADGVGADPGGLVAGPGFELLSHPPGVALVDVVPLFTHPKPSFSPPLPSVLCSGQPHPRLGPRTTLQPRAPE